jgi:hypothetical protein
MVLFAAKGRILALPRAADALARTPMAWEAMDTFADTYVTAECCISSRAVN